MLNTCIGTLGTRAVYISGNGRSDVSGIFDANYVVVDLNTGVVQSVGPMFSMNAADVPGGEWLDGDEIEIDGTVYLIIEERPDSESGTAFRLQRESR